VLFDLDRTLAHFDLRSIPGLLKEGCAAAHVRLISAGHRPPRLDRYVREIAFRFVMAALKSQLFRREIQIVDAVIYGHARMQIALGGDEAVDLCRVVLPLVFEAMTVDEESVALLTQLSERGFKLGLVSNTLAPHFILDEYLHAMGLLKHLPVRVYSSDTGYMKPHREIFREALNRLGSDACHCTFVGDKMRTDIRGASRMGMTTILVARDGKVPRGRIRPTHVVRRLSEIPQLLEQSHTI
jgi:FMN phosphatase YigB (HAD superfamily)